MISWQCWQAQLERPAEPLESSVTHLLYVKLGDVELARAGIYELRYLQFVSEVRGRKTK